MADFYIDPTKGPHAGADLTDEQVEYLCRLAFWELSVRTPDSDYLEFVEALPAIRQEIDDLVCQTRVERELMQFEADVMADLDDLPLTTDRQPPTGLYL